MNNRGISPLIATVLIIGFTVVLAAIIITWGGRFVTDIQEDVAADTDVSFECSKVDFDLTNLDCGVDTPDAPDNFASIDIVSNSNHVISEAVLRISNGISVVADTASLTGDVQPYGSGQLTCDITACPNPVNGPTEIEVIPTIDIPDRGSFPCPEVKITYTVPSSHACLS